MIYQVDLTGSFKESLEEMGFFTFPNPSGVFSLKEKRSIILGFILWLKEFASLIIVAALHLRGTGSRRNYQEKNHHLHLKHVDIVLSRRAM